MTHTLTQYPYNQHKFGINPDVDDIEDVVRHGGIQYFPDEIVPAASIDIVSSSTNDVNLGSGAWELYLDGIGTDLKRTNEVVTLNGTTAVHPVNDYWFLNQAHITECGSNGDNVGNITISVDGNVLAYIGAGRGQVEQCVYMFPGDYHHNSVSGIGCFIRGNAITTNAIVAVQFALQGHGWRTYDEMAVYAGTAGTQLNWTSFPVRPPPGMRLRLRVTNVSASNAYVSAYCNIWLGR